MDLEPFTFILERFGQLLVDEVKLLSTDKKKLLRSLQQELELAQSFVRDIEEEKQRATTSHVLETELQHIMLILPEIEDYLDTLQLENAQKSQKQSSFWWKFKAFFSCASNPFFHKHVVIDTALQLIKDLEDTRKRAEPYKRQSGISQVTRRRRPPTQPNIINEELIVGLDEDVRILIAKLAGKDTSILAIAGMGGSGKTTLTRKLYNHQEVKRLFKSQAWVCVSKDWDTSQLLHQMCVQLHIPLAESETSAAGLKLREFLQTNSYLVVLDDVWEIAALQELLPLLLSGGGTVLVTTRNEEILHYPFQGGVYIHKARPLTPEQSWDLFSKIVRNEWRGVRSFDGECVFAEPGREMLKRCRGLPLAIVALAGLLSTKGSIQEWEAMKENVITRIMTQNKGSLDYGPVKDMLELSYSDLPYDLKPCFLYLGIYPEDEFIFVKDLIPLWICEGFLRTDMCFEGQTLEELGMDVVNELVQRCTVQVFCQDYEENAEITQVHDLMRDFCIDKARETGFFNIISPSTMPSSTIEMTSRRAIIYKARHSYLVNSPRLRSVFLIWTEKLELVSGTTKLLRVLDLQGVELNNFESHIGNLILLRHLGIRGCRGVTQPVLEQLKKLKNLLTLVLWYIESVSITMPNDMVGSMEHLRCLILRGYELPTVLGLGRTKSLQSLQHTIRGECSCKELQAPSLVHTLRTLRLENICLQTQLDAVSDFVGTPSNHLQILYLSMYDVEVDIKRMKLECCLQLKSLSLWGGRIRKQEVPLLFPPNLLDLTLVNTKIEKEEDLGRALAQLYQLKRLLLSNSYDGDRLTMAGLPQLQELKLYHLNNLKEWRIEQGALCQLKDLELWDCSKLERIPEGISDIHTLQCLRVQYMPWSFCKRLGIPATEELIFYYTLTGEDSHLTRHIPTIEMLNIVYPEIEDNTECDEEGEDNTEYEEGEGDDNPS